MPAWIVSLLPIIQAAIKAAPDAVVVFNQAKAFFTTLFETGQISVEQQNAVAAQLEAITNAVLQNQVPPAWQVEPDPE